MWCMVSKKASISKDFHAIIGFLLGQVTRLHNDHIRKNEMERLYRADPKIIPPVVLAMGFGVFLLVLEGTTNKGFLLLLLLLPFFYLGAEILARKIILNAKGLEIFKFLRKVRVDWPDIRYLDAVKSGSKLFLILQHEHGRPILITNTISPFQDLVNRILENVPSNKVSDQAKEFLKDPPVKYGPLIQAWLACAVLISLVAGKMLGYG